MPFTPASNKVMAKMNRILVVDDENTVRELLSELLSNIGYQVVSAQNGYDGLKLFQNNSIELVLTDLDMPVMDGWSLAAGIKAKSPGTPVIIVTGLDKEEVSQKLKAGHVDGVIFKPFSVEEVNETVRKMLSTKESY